MDIRTTGQFLRDVEMMVRSRERGGPDAGGNVQSSTLRRLLDVAQNQIATNAEKRKRITESTEYKLAHGVADEGIREVLRVQVRRNQGHFTALNVNEAQLLIEYIDFLETEVGLRDPHLHISGVTDAQVDAHNASIDDEAPSGINVAYPRLTPGARASLIERAKKIAERGTPRSDGYDYLVPSRDLAETRHMMLALVAEIESLAERLPESPITPVNSVVRLEEWLVNFHNVLRESDIAEWALKQLAFQRDTIVRVKTAMIPYDKES